MSRVRQHQHVWHGISSHLTSAGWVTYQRCGCGRHRVLGPVYRGGTFDGVPDQVVVGTIQRQDPDHA